MSFWDIFRPLKSAKQTRWKELGAYTAIFSPFGQNMWQSDLVRSCIRPIAEHTSKAHATCSKKPEIAKILNTNPNMYMNGKDFLAKVRLWLEIKNTAFIYIARDDTGKPTSFYPVPYASFEALEYLGGLYIKFQFNNSTARDYVFPWEDLAVLRKDYYQSDIWGDDNSAILSKLDLINTAEQGVANAVRATANLRGILKSTKAMLSPESLKEQKEQFVTDYLNLENSGGIASIDATQDFIPITMNPSVTDAQTLKQLREDVYRYFGVNDKILTSDYNEEDMEAFYQSKIEPFLIALSEEMTRKVFTRREQDLGNAIIYESNRMGYSSNKTKLNMVQLVDRGILSPNELRQMFNMAPYEGGDEYIRRLDTMPTGTEAPDENKEE
jgi:HK97 family phage portal protein